jgi:hypothetical protein
MLRRNVAGQRVFFGLVNAATGAALTGATPAGLRGLDGGGQAAVTGTFTELGSGQYRFDPSQADTDGDFVGYLFTAASAIPVSANFITTQANPHDATAQIAANVTQISGDQTAADNLEAVLDGTGAILTLSQLRINAAAAGGAIDIDNSAGPAIAIASATTHGFEIVAGGNGHGLFSSGAGTGSGARWAAGTNGHGFAVIGGSLAGNGYLVQALFGHGFVCIGGSNAGSQGFRAESGVGGHGFFSLGDGAGDGFHAEGGATGDGFHPIGFGGGFDINADIQGSLSGSIGSVAANGINAASIATDAFDADAVAADAVAEIQAGLATALALAAVQTDTNDIQTRLPLALVGGRMDSSVGAMAANVLDAGALATSAVDEIVDQTWDELIAGHLGAGSTGAALNGATAPTAAQNADAVWDELLAGHLGVGSTGEALNNAAVGGAADWTPAERAQMRQALGITGATAPTDVTGDLKALTAAIFADTNDIQNRLPASLHPDGRMRSHVEACDPPCTPPPVDDFTAVPG